MSPTPERVLVVAPSWLGDATMATPAFAALRAAWPAARITVLCRPGIDALLAGLGAFDTTVVDRLGGLLGPWQGANRLRGERCDTAILFPNSFRTALAVRLAGIPRRVGYARDGRGALLTVRVAPSAERPRSTVDYYCDLLERALGIAVPDRRPRLGLTDEERAAGDAALRDVPRPFAMLVPGGNNPAKRWPPDRFARVAEYLAVRGLAVVVSGSPGERAVLDAVRQAAACPVFDLSTRSPSLGALKAVVAASSLVVTNDTGPRHLAAAFNVPTVALFGPTDHRWTILPGVPERLVVAEPFLPAELVADDRPNVCRMDRIEVDDVLAAIAAIGT